MLSVYSANINKAYPLETSSNLDPFIVDIRITSSISINPIVSSFSIKGNNNVFIAIEDSITKKAIAHCYISNSKPFSPYLMTTIIPGIYGWVVFSDQLVNCSYDRLHLKLDSTTYIDMSNQSSGIDKLISSKGTKQISGDVIITEQSKYLKIVNKSIKVNNIDVMCIDISRDDNNLSYDDLYNKLYKKPEISNAIYTINGISPDVEGSFNITTYNKQNETNPFTIMPIVNRSDSSLIGLVINEPKELCNEGEPEKKVIHGRCESGSSISLPADSIIEGYRPEYTEEDCGCNSEAL